MDIILRRLFTAFIFLIVIIEATDYNDTSPNEDRQPRTKGRIVKLYSGTKHEPIICTGEGFQKDPYNCAAFYRCMKSGNGKYTVFKFQCGPGTVYDPETEVCNHLRNTKRSECGGYLPPMEQTTHMNEIENQNNEIPSPININRPINVANTMKTTTISPAYDSNHSSTKRDVTTPSVSYPWGSSINNVYIDDGVTAYPLTSTKVTSRPFTMNTTPSTSSNISPSSSRENICTSDGFTGDSDNCRKFYRCVADQRGGYTRYEFSCTEGTIWDEDNQVCNHVWAVKKSRCSRHINKIISSYIHPSTQLGNYQDRDSAQDIRESKLNSTIQQQLQISYGSKVTQTQTQIGNSAVIQNQTQIHYGDRIHQVKKDKSQQQQTQVGQSFAVSQSQIQLHYGNKGVQTQLQIDHSNEASQSQVQINKPSKTYASSNEHVNSELTNTQKNNECTQLGFMGDTNDCKKFYRCVDNGRGGYTRYEFSCSEGTVWDQNIEACNHAWAVKECGSNTPSKHTTNTLTSSTHRTTFSTNTTTSTENYQIIPESEDTANEEADNGYQKPITMTSSTSTSTTSAPIDNIKGEGACISSGFMGDKNDCKIFYRCVENGNGGYIKYEFKCGEGTVWDPEIEACNHAWAVKKCGGNVPPNMAGSETTTNKFTTLSSVQNTAVTQTTTSTENYGALPEVVDTETNEDNGYLNPEPGPTSSTVSTIITLTTVENSKTGECTSSGFMGDSHDCKIFYRCVENGNGGYIKYEFKCGEGTVWDPEIEACNHAWAVDKCGSSTSSNKIEVTTEKLTTSTLVLPSSTMSISTTSQITSTEGDEGYRPPHSDISTSDVPPQSSQDSNQQNIICSSAGFTGDKHNCKKFYRCVDDGKGSYISYEFTCGEGTLWDQEIEACNHAWAVTTCGSSVTSSSEQYETTPQYHTTINYGIDNGYPSNVEPGSENNISGQTSSSTTETSKESSQISCTSAGFIGDPDDCKKFYRCVDNGNGNFIRYEFNCGEGTVWDQSIEACNHAWAVKECGSATNSTTKVPNESSISTTVTTATSLGQDYSQVTEGTPNIEKGPSVICSQDGFIGDSTNCKVFYRCVDDGKGSFTKYQFSCGEGTYWNQEILSCDHITSDRECGAVGSGSTTKPTIPDDNEQITEKSESTTHHDVEEGGYDNTSDNSNTKPISESTICTLEGYNENKNDCRKFYRCVDNGNGGFTKYDFTCSEGTAWDSNIQGCNHIDQVPSCKGSIQHDEDNSLTTETSATSAQDLSSSTTTTSTTQEATDSSKPNSESTTQTAQKAETCESEGFFGNTRNCKKFYRCVDNGKGGYTKYDFTCGEGTIWDQDLITCNHPGDVVNPSCNSTDGGTSTTEDSSSDNSPSDGSSSSTTESTTKSQSGQDGTTKKPEKLNVNCTKAGFYPNPNDCKKFYRCVDWDGDGTKFSVFHFECGEGTIWDPAVETCNHEESVYPPRDCSGSQSGNETQSSTTENTTTTKVETTTEPTSNTSTDSTTSSTTTEQSEESTTTKLEESTTQGPEEGSTKPTTSENMTEPTEGTTEKQEASTTKKPEESTTENLGEETTVKPSETTTTEQSSEGTTEKQSESTTEQSTEGTTEKQGVSTTEQSSEGTTEQAGQSTTEGTTEKTEGSTTDKNDGNTTEQTEGTTQQGSSTESTTLGQSTTEETTSEKTTTESSVSESSSTTESETSTNENSGNKDCPETDEDQYLFVCPSSFRRHPKYCNLFYQCDENEETRDLKLAVFTCPNGTIYDESQVKCVEESKAAKQCDGQIAQRRRVKRRNNIGDNDPILVSKDSHACPAAGYYAFEKDGDCSSGFLKCKRSKSNKLRGFIYQCPEGYIFWSVSRRCEKIDQVRDCKRSVLNSWSKRWEIPIEKRNVAWT